MKTKLITLGATLLLATSAFTHAAEPPKAAPASAEFERMKSLVGTWKGTADMGQGPVEMVSQYRLIAGGSVLEEKVFAGTPNEMTTMYFDKNGKLALTHYCVLGNRPGMVLESAQAKTMKFAFDKTCGINVNKESHMHSLTLTFVDADTITASCKAFMDGKEMPEHPTTMKRVKH
ncbi:MAG: Uncharacterized protein FD161_3369 [Limisphaerales bacterium]|nr:MAG: Uncharacterized protein FD161_3369 [Limisphaerales bacterium]KAG0507794.1 MAG: Uncharacterized protein E1N63_3035 [Limisphaerales bacterium]TXT48797.1 MAG: Uncharacterized protein FD140_3463 [Limisphaerales bacterium]